MNIEKCPNCNGSNFYKTGPNFDASLMGLDDNVNSVLGTKVTYTICKDCKNIQFWFKEK